MTSALWAKSIANFLDGLRVFVIEVEDEVYIGILITCIAIIIGFSALATLLFLCEIELDFCECVEELLLGVVMEYLLFGYFAVPILKMFVGSWNCIEKDGADGRYLRRAQDYKCGDSD